MKECLECGAILDEDEGICDECRNVYEPEEEKELDFEEKLEELRNRKGVKIKKQKINRVIEKEEEPVSKRKSSFFIDRSRRREEPKLGRIIGVCVPLFVFFILLANSIVSISAGNKGVIVSGFGVGEQLDEGWQLKNPFSGMEEVRYNTQMDMEIISARSADGYNVDIDMAVRYHLSEDMVGDIRVDNPDFKETVIKSTLRSEARMVVSDWNLTGEEMNSKRTLYENEVEERVKIRLEEYHIIVEDVMLRNLDFPDLVNQAWEKRASAYIDIEQAYAELEAERLRALKELMRAEAERNSTIVLAEGQAAALRILANETEGMNETVMNYILSLKYIAALRDPECNVKFIVVPMDGQPLILNLEDLESAADE